MKLIEVLKALANNTGASITLVDINEVELITFNAAGYKAVESDLGNRKVKRIKVDTATAISVYIDDEVIEDTQPQNPDDPNSGDNGNNTDPSDPGNSGDTDPSDP